MAARRGLPTVVVVAIAMLSCTTLLWLGLMSLSLSSAAGRSAEPHGSLAAADATQDDDLHVGECFLEPHSALSRVMVVDCADPHDGEVFAVTAPVPGWDTASPEVSQQVLEDRCSAPFADYTGAQFEDSPLDAMGAPWGSEDPTLPGLDGRAFICFAQDPAGPSSGSVRSAAAALRDPSV